MTVRSALLAATILATPAVALAQPVTGLYVGAGVGGNYLLQNNAKLTTPFSVGSGKLNDKGGFAGVASVGYGLGNGLRLELEVNGRDTHLKVGGGNGGGEYINYGGMVNALYDFNIGSALVPYVGVGAGYGATNLGGFKTYAAGGNPIFSVKNQDRGEIEAQAIIGVAYPIPGAPGLAVTGEYRFKAGLDQQKFSGTYINGAIRSGGSLKLDNQFNNSILVGLRYNFGVAPAPMAAAPAPAPVVAPAPAPARSYLVFFDWDKADLTARAQQIIAEAAQASTRVAATRIDVAGHADKSGTAVYNQALSLRRANNVAAELVRLGVPRTAISITAYGDTRPLVPTAAGVREPQNRRVEIVLK
jgi:outer membrane protein OmpA-like peptidoglycan-associated protein